MLIDGLAKKSLEIGPECENEYSQFTGKKKQLVRFIMFQIIEFDHTCQLHNMKNNNCMNK